MQTWSVEGIVARQGNEDDVYSLEVGFYGEGTEIRSLVRSGMSAVVSFDIEGERTQSFEGNVQEVVLMALIVPGAETFPGSNPANLVQINLDEKPDVASILGRNCTVVVELGRQSPLALFASRLL